MSIQFHNTLTGRKEEFRPLHPKQVTMYVCGVTVYDDCHIGHVRGAVVFDTLRRFLQASGTTVRHVRNITDVDDKIIERARRLQLEEAAPGASAHARGGADLKAAAKAVAQRYTERFQADFARLGLLPPHEEPKATEFIPQMIVSIQELVTRGMAYPAVDGVYFSVRKLKEYGQLSRQKPDQMMENAHVDAGAGKKDPLDFALWKKAKPEEPSWPSPWGEGRPGWHIECTTMSTDLLGDEFDIHGGGQDLVFPHHENELAQALGAGKPFAKLWLHNGLLTVNGQKMSKSLGNFVTIQDALKKHPADVLRYFFLTAHYRSPQDFTWERLDEAAKAYERLTTFLSHVATLLGETKPEDVEIAQRDAGIQNYLKDGLGFFKHMEDDLNTPKVLGSIFHLLEIANEDLAISQKNPAGLTSREFTKWSRDHKSTEIPKMLEQAQANTVVLRDRIQELCRILGFFQSQKFSVPSDVQKLVAERDFARNQKDFPASDRIRKQLMEMGYVVEDTSKGTVVRSKI